MRFRHLDLIEKFKLISWETIPFQSQIKLQAIVAFMGLCYAH